MRGGVVESAGLVVGTADGLNGAGRLWKGQEAVCRCVKQWLQEGLGK